MGDEGAPPPTNLLSPPPQPKQRGGDRLLLSGARATLMLNKAMLEKELSEREGDGDLSWLTKERAVSVAVPSPLDDPTMGGRKSVMININSATGPNGGSGFTANTTLPSPPTINTVTPPNITITKKKEKEKEESYHDIDEHIKWQVKVRFWRGNRFNLRPIPDFIIN